MHVLFLPSLAGEGKLIPLTKPSKLLTSDLEVLHGSELRTSSPTLSSLGALLSAQTKDEGLAGGKSLSQVLAGK